VHGFRAPNPPEDKSRCGSLACRKVQANSQRDENTSRIGFRLKPDFGFNLDQFLLVSFEIAAMINRRKDVAAEIRQNWQKAPMIAPCR
jgi:hypothetical protein